MAQNIQPKQQAFLARFQQQVCTALDQLNALNNLVNEWNANGYAPGAAAVDGTSWNLTDAVVQAQIPALTAANVASAEAAVVTLLNTLSANLGYLIVLRP